jgi:predicted O-methyltransferase YrrM
MKHFYQNIEGWFSYEYIYEDIVQQSDDGSLFVEIGSFKGKSSAFMAVEIANSGKKIKFDCIDPMLPLGHYAGSAESNPDEWQGYSADEFHNRMQNVKEYYTLHQMTSDEAASLYADGSIDFLMIDGDHSYEGVVKDLQNYLPKMRPGGLIAGDDAFVPEIVQAVKDVAGHLNPQFTGIHFFISIPEING